MRRVLLVNASIYLPGEGGYKRTLYMFDMMRRAGYDVTLITGDFNHYKKETRDIAAFRKEYPDYGGIEFLHMPPYKKNICLKRIFAEKSWARNLGKWFKKNYSRFDVVFFSDIDYVYPVMKTCKKHGIGTIVDIRDLRPEAFKVVVRNEFLYNLLFWGMKIKADKGYAFPDELTAVSREYLDRGLRVNKKSKDPCVVYLGSTLERFDDGVAKYAAEFGKKDGEFRITYAGTLGESYDIATLIKAAAEIGKEYDNVTFKILGQGPDLEKLENLRDEEKDGNVEFVGFLPYEKMAAYLSKSDVTVNAVKKTASQSIINKVADYFAAGIPMLNGCACKEQRDMVEEYNVGLNYEPEDVGDLVAKIKELIANDDERKVMGENARKLALEKFDRKTSYKELLKRIDEV